MAATTSIIQRIGPVKKPIEKPSNHKMKRMIPMTKSKVNILTSFYLVLTADIIIVLTNLSIGQSSGCPYGLSCNKIVFVLEIDVTK